MSALLDNLFWLYPAVVGAGMVGALIGWLMVRGRS